MDPQSLSLSLDTDRLVRPSEFAARLGVSLVTLWRLRRRGVIPEPKRISQGCVGWRSSEVAHVLATIDAPVAQQVPPSPESVLTMLQQKLLKQKHAGAGRLSARAGKSRASEHR